MYYLWLVPPLASSVLLANITTCTAAQLGGRTFERKAPFATTSFKKGRWAYFEGGPVNIYAKATPIVFTAWQTKCPELYLVSSSPCLFWYHTSSYMVQLLIIKHCVW